MDDLELINLASKASGFEYTYNSNPLNDDALALRLAVNLGICFGPNFDGDTAVCFGADGRNITEPHGEDKTAATRRAIVRAAAAIGEQA